MWSAARSAKISMILCMPERVSGGDAKFQGFCDRWNKWEGQLYGRVRHAVMIEGLSQREAARCFGIDPRTVRKMLSYSVPPGYVRTRPPVRPKLDPFIGIIDRILEEDKDRPKKQRHTSKRIFERLRDECGFTGKITIVKDYICGVRQRRREMFVPLTHPPGHAQVDFGESLAVIGGVERKIHFLAMSLPHSDACFVKAYAQRFKAHIVNYADDLVVLGKAPSADMLTAFESLMQRLKLTVNAEKTRCCRVPEEPIEFLGYRIGRNYRRDTGRAYIGTRPSQASVQSICRRVSEVTARRYGLLETNRRGHLATRRQAARPVHRPRMRQLHQQRRICFNLKQSRSRGYRRRC